MAAKTLRRLLVPVAGTLESLNAVDVACRLAADTGALVELVRVVEVPALLPLDARMSDEEAQARVFLRAAEAVAGSYGVAVAARMVRARDAAAAIADEAERSRSQLIVIGAPRRRRARPSAPVFGSTVQHVLKRAPCRVMLITAGEVAAATGNGSRRSTSARLAMTA